MAGIEYLGNPRIKEMIENGTEYKKSEVTFLRKPAKYEIGNRWITYVGDEKYPDGYRVESNSASVGADDVIARNGKVLGYTNGEPVYNEWPIGKPTVVKNYGQEIYDGLTDDFVGHKKKATVKAIEITRDVMNKLGVKGDVLEVKVSWSDKPMIAHLGDYLTSGGYSISKENMKDYDVINTQKHEGPKI